MDVLTFELQTILKLLPSLLTKMRSLHPIRRPCKKRSKIILCKIVVSKLNNSYLSNIQKLKHCCIRYAFIHKCRVAFLYKSCKIPAIYCPCSGNHAFSQKDAVEAAGKANLVAGNF